MDVNPGPASSPAGARHFWRPKSAQKRSSPKWALSYCLGILLSRPANVSRLHHDPAAPVLPLGILLLKTGLLLFALGRILYHIGKTMRPSSGLNYTVEQNNPSLLGTGPDVSGRPSVGDVILNE